MDRGVKKVPDHLKDKRLLAVPFYKSCRFCVMKRSTYREELNVILNSDKFKKITEEKDEFAIKNEKQVNNSRRQLMKQRNNSDKMYERLGSTSSKQARCYGLAKEHKNDIPLQPVL